MRRYALASVVVIALGFIAVSGDCIPVSTPTAPAPRLASTYLLLNVGGQPLPAVVSTVAGRSTRVFGDTLRFDTAHGTYTEAGEIGVQEGTQPEVRSHYASPTPAPSYGAAGTGQITLPVHLAGTASGSYDAAGRLSLTVGGQQWVYAAR